MLRANSRSCWHLSLTSLLVLCSLVVAVLVAPNKGFAATSAADNFNRANGALGSAWTNMGDGGLTISNQTVVGTSPGANSGDIRTAETYANDQYSQITVTATALTGTQWIGPTVRTQNGGQNLYVGIYYWNNGDPALMLFKRTNGAWTQLGSAYSTGGALTAGTTLTLTAVANTLTFAQNGVTRVTATDTTVTSGAPGIMAYGAASADNWAGGSEVGTYSVSGSVSGLTGRLVLQNNSGDNLTLNADGPFTFPTLLAPGAAYTVTVAANPTGQTCTVTNNTGNIGANVTNVAVTCTAGTTTFQVSYQSTDVSGIASYSVLSTDDGDSTQSLRVLKPTHPAARVAHNFLFVLPVEPGLGNNFGDGLATLQALDAEDKYNLTIIEPTFADMPWYANSATDPNMQYETFMTKDLVPWVKANLSTTGTEQNWLIGYSKSGNGAQDLILRHPDLFNLAASWDFPADMSSYDQYAAATSYGSQANFAANYQLTPAFLAAHKAPFLSRNRIWIAGYSLYQQDVSDYNALLTAQGILHTNGPSKNVAHRWDSGWMAGAVAALYQDSVH